MANITLLGATYTDVPAVDLPQTGGGTVRFYENGGASRTVTGTVTGTGTATLEIPCAFAPDLIYVHWDLSGAVANRGVVSVMILKDTVLYSTADSSSSTDAEYAYRIFHNITGYNESDLSDIHASYENGVLTIDTANGGTSAGRFPSGITYSYELIAWS